MHSHGDKKSICNGENKTKEVERLLVIICSFIINDDANIALRHFALKMKTLSCLIPNMEMEKFLEQTWEIECE